MFKTMLATVALVAAGAASAAVVPFLTYPTTSWADGTLSSGLAGAFADGFYNYADGPTRAFNGYGQNGESIRFNSPVVFNSLTLGTCGFCGGYDATTVTVSLYDAADAFLTSQTVAPTATLALLNFDLDGVARATFSFSGGTNIYGDGRLAAFYNVNDVTYSAAPVAVIRFLPETPAAVPEPAAWALMIIGFGLVGTGLRQRRMLRVA
jgi:hypothetical protein